VPLKYLWRRPWSRPWQKLTLALPTALQVDAIGALLSRPEALDARQRALREALARYDSSWRAELAVRARALEVDGEHSEAMALPSPR
jgi:hypothetical protein